MMINLMLKNWVVLRVQQGSVYLLPLYIGLLMSANLFAQDSETATDEVDNQPQLTVLEKGQAPHQLLRVRAKTGQKSRHEMAMSLKMKSEANGDAMPAMDMPKMKFVMETTVTDVSSNGDISSTIRYSDIGVEPGPDTMPGMVEAMEGVLKSMIGITIKSVVDNRGIPKENSIDMPDSVNPMVRQQMEETSKSLDQMISPFPEEAIGLGGKWKLVSPMEAGGMKLVQTAVFTIVELDSESVSVTVEISQQADPQDINLPNAPGTTARLKSYKCTGKGKSKLSLTSILPDESNADIAVEMELTVSTFGQEIAIVQDLETKVALKALPPKE